MSDEIKPSSIEPFSIEPFSPASLPLPRRIGVGAAFDAYVTSRHKSVPAQEKIAADSGRGEELGSEQAESGSTANANLRPRFGVGIPERLVFHRGAGTWRDRLPSGASQHGADRD
ncbi:MAG: hypothetical protein ABFS14_03180 [Gemmatimonadota bacterium]